MTVMEALMPTHNELIQVATMTQQPAQVDLQTLPVDDTPLRKYLILRDPDGAEHPLIFSRSFQHSAMVPAGSVPVAAGFILVWNGRISIPAIGSSTLNMDPRPQDKAILESFLAL